MKIRIKTILIAVLAVITYTSCEDYFDSVPSDTINLDKVFSERKLAYQWLSNIYSYLPDESEQNYTGGDDETRGVWTPASLEGKLPWGHNNSNKVTGGTIYPSTDYVTKLYRAHYRAIQKANIYLQRIDGCTDMPEAERKRTKTEARALRSIFYFNLFKIYGPFVNIEDDVYDPESSLGSMTRYRSSVDECVNYIVSEFDAVLKDGYLSSHFEEGGTVNTQFAGNISYETVEAIRSQVLLYAASYLFNGDPFYKDLKDHEGKFLFPQSKDQQKWVKARKAAKDFIDNNPRFRLVYRDITGTPVSTILESCPYNSANEAALGRSKNEEMIFMSTRNGWNLYYYMRPKHTGIVDAQSGAGALAAPLQMVDLYFTNKGLRIEDDPDYYTYTNDEESKFTSRNMTSAESYKDKFSGYTYFTPAGDRRIMKQFYNREPRFYIAFTFQNRQWTFDTSKTYYTDFSLNGNSGRAKNGHDFPKSGMLARKKMNTGDTPYNIFIRLSEIYLNYAEASNECDDIAEAIKYVNMIRARAGVAEYKGMGEDATPLGVRGEPRIEIPLTKESVTNIIRRERLIELAYENHRYFDVRRWGIAGMQKGDGWVYPTWHTGGEGGRMVGFDVEVDMAPETSEYPVNPLYFYKRIEWETRIYTERMKLFPIPQDEINVNRLIVQNTGWGSDIAPPSGD